MHITLRTMGWARARSINRGTQGQCVEKVVYSGDRCYFLYLATWNIPRMIHKWSIYGKMLRRRGDIHSATQAHAHSECHFTWLNGAARLKIFVDVKSSEVRRSSCCVCLHLNFSAHLACHGVSQARWQRAISMHRRRMPARQSLLLGSPKGQKHENVEGSASLRWVFNK